MLVAIQRPELVKRLVMISGGFNIYPTQVESAVRDMPGVVDVDTSLNVGKPEVSVSVDRLKAADLGVEISEARRLPGFDEVRPDNREGHVHSSR